MQSGELNGKRIILGITGSIAAVKAPQIARELMRRGATVISVLTESAQRFTTAMAMSALTQQPAITSIFPKEKTDSNDAGTWHIHLARSADAMLIAPCSAATLGRLRVGIYDNPVTLLAGALPRITPLIIAPAMDEEMWLQPAVQASISELRSMGAQFIDPVSGLLASGLTGMGRMMEPVDLVTAFASKLAPPKLEGLEGKRILITGGPTHEPIDPVRFLGNRSSGKMAMALATIAQQAGADVTLIMGPSQQATAPGVLRINIETAAQMHEAVMQALPQSDIVIMAAAVADFTSAAPLMEKIKKRTSLDETGHLNLKLAPTTDILREIASHKTAAQIIVGFALETGDGAEDYARSKLEAKGLDLVVLNRSDEAGAGFGHDTNKITLFGRGGSREELPLMSKDQCAIEILRRVTAIRTKSE